MRPTTLTLYFEWTFCGVFFSVYSIREIHPHCFRHRYICIWNTCASELCNSFYRDRRDLNHFLLISVKFNVGQKIHYISRQFRGFFSFFVKSFSIFTLSAFQVIVFRVFFSPLFFLKSYNTFECVSIWLKNNFSLERTKNPIEKVYNGRINSIIFGMLLSLLTFFEVQLPLNFIYSIYLPAKTNETHSS